MSSAFDLDQLPLYYQFIYGPNMYCQSIPTQLLGYKTGEITNHRDISERRNTYAINARPGEVRASARLES